MYMCVPVHIAINVSVMCVPPKATSQLLTLLLRNHLLCFLFFLFFKTGSLTGLEHANYNKLAGQRASGLPLPLLSARVTSVLLYQLSCLSSFTAVVLKKYTPTPAVFVLAKYISN